MNTTAACGNVWNQHDNASDIAVQLSLSGKNRCCTFMTVHNLPEALRAERMITCDDKEIIPTSLSICLVAAAEGSCCEIDIWQECDKKCCQPPILRWCAFALLPPSPAYETPANRKNRNSLRKNDCTCHKVHRCNFRTWSMRCSTATYDSSVLKSSFAMLCNFTSFGSLNCK